MLEFIHTFLSCCHEFFCKQRSIILGRPNLCSLWASEKGIGWLEAMFPSNVKGLLQWRYYSCAVLMNEQTCCYQLISWYCSVHWLVFLLSPYTPLKHFMKRIRLVAIPESLLLPATLQQPSFFQELTFTDWSAFCLSLCWHRNWYWQKKRWEGIGL